MRRSSIRDAAFSWVKLIAARVHIGGGMRRDFPVK